MSASARIQDRAIGRWQDVLPAVGISRDFLKPKHGPCPLCGGKDRFRFDNKGGNGTYFCSNPSCGPGSGVDLVMKFLGVQFLEAKREIEKHLPDSRVVMPKARTRIDPARLERVWLQAQHLDGTDIASRYLASRSINVSRDWPSQVRSVFAAKYRHEDGSITEHPAMVARATGGNGWTLHYTFLDFDTALKAKVPMPKKLAPARFPEGGAVRLSRPAETMGIAEGIETALSAAILYGMPVWAALSAPMLAKWKPPGEARTIVIFADNDRSFAGQHAAYALAQSLNAAGYGVEVCIPRRPGSDWNDVLVAQGVL